jgi:hypothetical protein
MPTYRIQWDSLGVTDLDAVRFRRYVARHVLTDHDVELTDEYSGCDCELDAAREHKQAVQQAFGDGIWRRC